VTPDAWPRNPLVRSWLDAGRGVEALLGQPPFVVRDRHWGVHDTPLVLRQIGYRVADGADPAEAARWLIGALDRLVADGRLTDALRFIHDVRSSAVDAAGLPALDPEAVRVALRRLPPIDDEERERAAALAPHVAADLAPLLEQLPRRRT
jgi:hypothetical protein